MEEIWKQKIKNSATVVYHNFAILTKFLKVKICPKFVPILVSLESVTTRSFPKFCKSILSRYPNFAKISQNLALRVKDQNFGFELGLRILKISAHLFVVFQHLTTAQNSGTKIYHNFAIVTSIAVTKFWRWFVPFSVAQSWQTHGKNFVFDIKTTKFIENVALITFEN